MPFIVKELLLQEQFSKALEIEAEIVIQEEKAAHKTYGEAINCLLKQAKEISTINTTLTKEQVEVERQIYQLAAKNLEEEASLRFIPKRSKIRSVHY